MKFRRRLPALGVGLALTLLFLWLQVTRLPMLREGVDRIEAMLYDLRLKTTLPPRSVDPRIVIVDIDEASLKQEGQWPWPRARLALLVQRMFEQGAQVAGFDVVFPEAERNDAAEVLERLTADGRASGPLADELRARLPEFDNDGRLAAALHGRDVVLGFVFDSSVAQDAGMLPEPLPVALPARVRELRVADNRHFIGNLPLLQQAARRAGFFSFEDSPLEESDVDGLVRRVPLVSRFHGGLYGSLALEVYRLFLLVDELHLETVAMAGYSEIEALRLADRSVPTVGAGQVLVPYRGRQGSFTYLSAGALLRGESAPALQGALVLVGTSARGMSDLRSTPVGANFPGVEIHANVLSGLLDGRFPSRPSWAAGADFALLGGLGLLLAMSLPFLTPLRLVVLGLACGVGLAGFNFWLWLHHGYALGLALPLLLTGTLASFNAAAGFFAETRSTRSLKANFGQYVPPHIVEQMSENPESYHIHGETREMTVLFADIRNFTGMSESLGATELRHILNDFFTPITEVIFAGGGTIDKYVGDMVMAFWGAPVADPDHARNAVETALAMLAKVKELEPLFRERGYPAIEIGIGINSGPMHVGDMGSQFRRAYTVLGDAVNLGARLEGATKLYGAKLVIGQRTRDLVGDRFVWRELDLLRVKGKREAVHAFEPVVRSDALTATLAAELTDYARALAAFRAREFAAAAVGFGDLAARSPETRLYRVYLERIAYLDAHPPPPDWDAVFERREK